MARLDYVLSLSLSPDFLATRLANSHLPAPRPLRTRRRLSHRGVEGCYRLRPGPLVRLGTSSFRLRRHRIRLEREDYVGKRLRTPSVVKFHALFPIGPVLLSHRPAPRRLPRGRSLEIFSSSSLHREGDFASVRYSQPHFLIRKRRDVRGRNQTRAAQSNFLQLPQIRHRSATHASTRPGSCHARRRALCLALSVPHCQLNSGA